MSIQSIRADIANFIRATFNVAQQKNTFLHWVAEQISAQQYLYYKRNEPAIPQLHIEERNVQGASATHNLPSPSIDQKASRNQGLSDPTAAHDLPHSTPLSDSFIEKTRQEDNAFIVQPSLSEHVDQSVVETKQSAVEVDQSPIEAAPSAEAGLSVSSAQMLQTHGQWAENRINKLKKGQIIGEPNLRKTMRELIKLTASEQPEKVHALLYLVFNEFPNISSRNKLSDDAKDFYKNVDSYAEAEKSRGKYDERLLQAIQKNLVSTARDFLVDNGIPLSELPETASSAREN